MTMSSVLKVLALGVSVAALAFGAVPGVPLLAAHAQSASPMASAPLQEATIKALQQALNAQGVPVKVDGVLNDETRAAIRTFQSQHHLPVTGEPDRATLDKLGVGVAGAGTAGSAPMPGQAMGGPGMGRGMMGQGMMGQGMMGPGTMSPGMMGQGMMGHGTMGPGAMEPGMMGPMMRGPGMARGDGDGRGMAVVPVRHLSVDDVRHFLEHWIADTGNKRIKIGEVKQVDDERIAADIVTQDGALVDRFEVDRHSGRMSRVE
jgi:hypothetical protein